MKIIDPSFRWLGGKTPDGQRILERITEAGRICYQSEKIGDEAAFVKRIIERGHESVLEHATIGVRLICDRGVTHEIVRHRIASYSQESTRYCNYSKGKFDSEITFIRPWWMDADDLQDGQPKAFAESWINACANAEQAYMRMIGQGATPEAARAVLPNSLKTEIAITMNLREWRHFFRLRCDIHAHPDMRLCANMLLKAFREAVPVIFDDIGVDENA